MRRKLNEILIYITDNIILLFVPLKLLLHFGSLVRYVRIFSKGVQVGKDSIIAGYVAALQKDHKPCIQITVLVMNQMHMRALYIAFNSTLTPAGYIQHGAGYTGMGSTNKQNETKREMKQSNTQMVYETVVAQDLARQ